MTARTLVVYAVADPQGGGGTHPTKAAALADARGLYRHYTESNQDGDAGQIEVTRVTIPGPFNRDLVCKLLSSGGYASDVVVIWRAGHDVVD